MEPELTGEPVVKLMRLPMKRGLPFIQQNQYVQQESPVGNMINAHMEAKTKWSSHLFVSPETYLKFTSSNSLE